MLIVTVPPVSLVVTTADACDCCEIGVKWLLRTGVSNRVELLGIEVSEPQCNDVGGVNLMKKGHNHVGKNKCGTIFITSIFN